MSLAYNRFKYLLMSGGIDLDTSDIRALLCTASYTPNADHNFVSDITNECAGTGYVRKALASKTVTEDDTNDRAYFDAADIVWTGANFGTPTQLILYLYNAADASAELLYCLDIASPVATNGGDLTVVVNAGGLVRLS